MTTDTNNFVSCDIFGDLGEQLTQITATFEYAITHNKQPIFRKNCNCQTYWDTLFNNKLIVIEDEDYDQISFKNTITYNTNIPFSDLPQINGNVKLCGSFKYFNYISTNTRKIMIDLIYSNEDFMYNAYDKYTNIKKYFGNIEDNDLISMYISSQNNDMSFYIKAYNMIKFVEKKNLVVFTDDVQWCSKNLMINDAYFIDINENICESFILMSFFQHNIICDKSFGLFASYISSFKKKIIVIPDKLLDTYKSQQFFSLKKNFFWNFYYHHLICV